MSEAYIQHKYFATNHQFFEYVLHVIGFEYLSFINKIQCFVTVDIVLIVR